MSLQPIIDALIAAGKKVRRTATGWQAQCPSHEDKTPSLSLNEPTLIYCHRGCQAVDVLGSLGLSWSDVLDEDSGGGDGRSISDVMRSFRQKTKRRDLGDWVPAYRATGAPPERLLLMDGILPSTRYKFRDSDGRVLYGTLRWDMPDGRKEMRPLTCWLKDGQVGWALAAPLKPRPIYGLDRLAKSALPVIICEGEKAADAVAEAVLGYIGIGWHGGAEAVQWQDWQPVKDAIVSGREVYLWPDADDAGRKAMRWLAGHLGDGVRLVDVPDSLPKGWDLADPVPPGFDPAEALAAAADVDPDRDYRQLLREVLESSPRFEGLRLRGLDVHLSVAVTSDPRACWLDTKDPEGWARQYAVWLDEADPEGDVSHLAHTHWLPNGERLQMACAMCEQTDDHGDDDEEWELV